MALVTDVLHAVADAPAEPTVDQLARRLHCEPRDVAGAVSVLEAQGLVRRARARVGLTKLGHRCVPVAS